MKVALRVVALLFGVLFLVFSFSQVQWPVFFATLKFLQPELIFLSAASLLFSMFMRSVRWRISTGLPASDHPKVWEAACAGYLGIIYPARAGEVLRMLRLKQLTGVGGGLAIGGAVIDRILDGLALCYMLAILVLIKREEVMAWQVLLGFAFIFFMAGTAMVVFVIRGHRLRTLFHRLAALGTIGVRLHRWYEECLAGLQVLRSPRQISLALLVQGIVSLFDVLACWLLILAFGWSLPFTVSLIILVYLTAAVSLPSTPGYVGMYQTATLFALRPFGIESSAAIAYGTILQGLTLALFISVGVWAVFKQKARDQC